MKKSAFKQLKIAFQKKIIPLLQEYFFDDWNKIRLVLADNQKQDDNQQFVIEKTHDLDTLFGNNHGLRRHDQQSTTYAQKIPIKGSGICQRLIVQFISHSGPLLMSRS